MSADADTLVDEVARRRIEADLSSTLFVEAGAGTGKTTALVGRIVALVESGACELREVAAITFTEAAAFELRDRVRVAVADNLAATPRDPRWERASAEVDEAVMGTIHGFCQRLLGEYPLAAGLPVRFQVLDDVAARLAFGRDFSAFLDALYDEPVSRTLLAAASSLQITPSRLQLLALQLEEYPLECEAQAPPVPPELSGRIESEVGAAVESLRRALGAVVALGARCTDRTDTLYGRVAELAEAAQRAGELADWVDELRFLAELKVRRPGGFGRRESWDLDPADVRAAIVEANETRDRELTRISELVVEHLLERLCTEAVRRNAERRAAGTLRFQDLLACTYELLKSSPQIRAAARARYRRILVDEFQDTDPLQLKILLLLGARDEGAPPDPGRLFFVGDPAQSIYRFRGADVDAYRRALERLVDEPTRLVANFRSVPGVLEWVNGVFGELFGPDPARSGFAPLAAVRGAEGDGPAVIVLGGASEGSLTAAGRRERESEDIAALLEAALAEPWAVRDYGEWRDARLSDVAILVPRRTGLSVLESALSYHQLPYRVASSTLIYGSDEVRDLLAALGALDSGADERALVAALRTPAFACSDEELLAYRLAGGAFAVGARAPDSLTGGAVERALAALADLRAERYRLGVLGLLEKIVEERFVLATAAATPRRAEALHRIDFVLDRARSFEDSGGGQIAAFLSLLEFESELAVRSIELPPAPDGAEALTILTVHGAKGLEFPIVVLAELGGQPVRRGPGVLVRDGRIEARLVSGIETPGYAGLAREEDEAELAETHRLAYVGATRAKDHLVLALHHTPAKSDGGRSLAERLFDAARHAGVGSSHNAPMSNGALPLGEIAAPPDHAPLDEAGLDAWRAERAELLIAIARPRSVAATALEPEAGARRTGRPESDEADELSWRRPRAATKVGRAVHVALQRLTAAAIGDLRSECAAAAREEDCAPEVELVVALVEAALEAPIVRRAAIAESCYCELPFSLALDDGLLEGVVDLLFFENSGRAVLVDYKTDALASPAEVPTAGARYRAQAGAYALGVEALLGRPLDRAVLLFLASPGGAFEYEVPDLDGAKREAAARAAHALSGA